MLKALFPDRAEGAPSMWCRLGVHRWLGPGMFCEECEYPDVIFDPPGVAQRRLDEWRRNRWWERH